MDKVTRFINEYSDKLINENIEFSKLHTQLMNKVAGIRDVFSTVEGGIDELFLFPDEEDLTGEEQQEYFDKGEAIYAELVNLETEVNNMMNRIKEDRS
jgi:hypothetical protein